MVAAATITSRRVPFELQGPSSGLLTASRTERQAGRSGPRAGRPVRPQTAASVRTGRAPRPPLPLGVGRNRPAAAPRAPGAPHSGSSSIAPAASRAPLRQRRRRLRSGGRCYSPSRPRRYCRGRSARIWREPRRPPRPTRGLGEAESRDGPPREEGSSGSILARAEASIAPMAPLLIFPRWAGLFLGRLSLAGSRRPAIGGGWCQVEGQTL